MSPETPRAWSYKASFRSSLRWNRRETKIKSTLSSGRVYDIALRTHNSLLRCCELLRWHQTSCLTEPSFGNVRNIDRGSLLKIATEGDRSGEKASLTARRFLRISLFAKQVLVGSRSVSLVQEHARHTPRKGRIGAVHVANPIGCAICSLERVA